MAANLLKAAYSRPQLGLSLQDVLTLHYNLPSPLCHCQNWWRQLRKLVRFSMMKNYWA